MHLMGFLSGHAKRKSAYRAGKWGEISLRLRADCRSGFIEERS